ncbi:MAG: M56 family metallopeptidase [Flavobacteriia bacterium]|nr:M56 family metallopeptidase [Flavobacteriia bacterium]
METIVSIILCSGLFLIFYRLFLQNEKMFVFNRIFLISALILSVAIPFMKIQKIKPIENQISRIYQLKTIQKPQQTTAVVQNTIPIQNSVHSVSQNQTEKTIDIQSIIQAIYFSIALLLMIRFLNNLNLLFKKIRTAKKLKKNGYTIVLIGRGSIPFSFLNYMFVAEDEFENDFLSSPVFGHELTHIRQKHSLDVILVEILKIIFWFNPFIWSYKKQIQLNHEFLADSEVNRLNYDSIDYKLLLIESAAGRPNVLSSSFSYLSTKKRIIMMSKNTTKTRQRILQSLSIPLFISGMLIFSQTAQAQQKDPVEGVSKKEMRQFNRAAKKVNKEVMKTSEKINSKQKEVDQMNSIYQKMNDEQKSAAKLIYPAAPDQPKVPTPPTPPTPPSVPTVKFDQKTADFKEAILEQAEIYFQNAQPFYDKAMVYYDQAMPFYDKAQEYYEAAQRIYASANKFRTDFEKFRLEGKTKEFESAKSEFENQMKLYGFEMNKYKLEMEKYGQEMSKYGNEMMKYSDWMKKYGIEMGKYGNFFE